MPLPVVPIPLSTRQSLIARIANPGDQAGWSEFTAVYGPLVYADLRRRGFDHDAAEDITQRVFVGSGTPDGILAFDWNPSTAELTPAGVAAKIAKAAKVAEEPVIAQRP